MDFRDVETIGVARVTEDERLGVELFLFWLRCVLSKALARRKCQQREKKDEDAMFQNIFHALFSLFKFLI